jgi:hypothetical protein
LGQGHHKSLFEEWWKNPLLYIRSQRLKEGIIGHHGTTDGMNIMSDIPSALKKISHEIKKIGFFLIPQIP